MYLAKYTRMRMNRAPKAQPEDEFAPTDIRKTRPKPGPTVN
jgi:hypothetical protein